MVFFFVDVTYISIRFYVIDPIKSNKLLFCCITNIIINISSYLIIQRFLFKEIFDYIVINIFKIEFLCIYVTMILGSLNLSYIYDILFRRYVKDDLLYIKELLNVKTPKSILNRFLKKWFNSPQKIYFPKILYSIYKFKNNINPILMDVTYPMTLFDGNKIFKTFLPDFTSRFIAKTYIFMKMFMYRR
jgi:hypothetical protein